MTEQRQTVALDNRAIAARIFGLYLAPRWKALSVSVLCAVLFAGLSGLLLNVLQPAVDQLNHRADSDRKSVV